MFCVLYGWKDGLGNEEDRLYINLDGNEFICSCFWAYDIWIGGIMNWECVGDIFSSIGYWVTEVGYWFLVGGGVLSIITVVILVVWSWLEYVMTPLVRLLGLM